jgi:glutaredoxin
MGKLLLFVVLGVCAMGGWRYYQQHAAQADEGVVLPEAKGRVVVYGRDTCSYTRRALAFLTDNGVPHAYVDIDAPGVNDAFLVKFRNASFMGKGGYYLPVVDINGHASARPDLAGLLTDFRISQRIASQTAQAN